MVEARERYWADGASPSAYANVIDGYVSRAAAERDYGVILTKELEINWEATKRMRGAPRVAGSGDAPIRRPPGTKAN